MKKSIIKIIMLALIVIITIISIFANFYIPSSNIDDIELTVNVNGPEYQPIFIAKESGITQTINASFDVKTISPNSAVLKSINLNYTTLSGLINYKFDSAFYSMGKEPSDPTETRKDMIWIIMSPWSKDTMIPVKLTSDKIVFDTNKPGKIITRVRYMHPIKINFKNQCDEFTGIEKFDCIKEYILSDDGRICNVNCIHE